MQIIQREIKEIKTEEINEQMNGSIINNVRLSLKWFYKSDSSNDIIINFTKAETDLIREILRRPRG